MPAKKCHSGSERRKVAQTFHSNNPVETSELVRDGHPAGDRRNVLHVLKKPGNSMTRKMKTIDPMRSLGCAASADYAGHQLNAKEVAIACELTTQPN
jgi:hypothetical protein